MKNIIYFTVILSSLIITKGFSQDKKSSDAKLEEKSNVVMTWNKDTPEQEMNDDIKALANYGVTISYSNVKRNEQKEITAIKVTYADKNGSKGTMELDNQKPINTIKIFKDGDQVGFGEPSNGDFIAGNTFANEENFMRHFNFGGGDSDGQIFSFDFPNGEPLGKSNSKIIIQNDGKKPLVIENGKVTEGGEDYTPEEIEKIKKEHKTESFGDNMSKFNFNFDSQNMGDLNDQMQKMQQQLDQLMSKDSKNRSNDSDQTIKEMNKAKEEMQKAKEEMEQTTKELKKAKSSLKTQKA